ncbi:D-alanyl-D-alanine carboxypeptidase/D-alanyl-D-alanine-endopeptidase [Thalassovita sp.]|uniref:D-alanyl-D-alanine carboxypeptidase/D-alanyl-D-alanine endopeptidase n=1 Tax=Thalassovita sp. TaxID=1979401 RepID=UPI0029DE5907|nr:D-alanyl-D-alanine carboxypeptidase/D-alanyl-D-alanine-endopeptidase [Thalassovita sp.]
MKQGVSRRSFLCSAAGFLAASPAFAAPPVLSLRPHIRPDSIHKLAEPAGEALIARARLSGEVSFAVAEATTGRVLENRVAETGLPPASVTKVVTALYALEHLGAAHRFRTRLITTGPVVDGIVQGDLVLAGGGDPMLDTDALAALASRLKKSGVRGVQGRFLVWGGAVAYARQIDPEQPEHVGYNPAVSGLSLNFNRVHFEWKRAGKGWGVTMDARSDRHRPDVQMATMAVVQRDMPVYTYRDKGGMDSWTVASSALGNGGARWLPVRRPDIYAGEVFRTFARAHGIELKPETPVGALPAGTTLATHESDTLREILRGMLKYSTNLTAELVGMAATQARLGKTPDLQGSAREMSRWAAQRLGMTRARLVDHSGLGDGSRMSSLDMVRALVAARQSGPLPDLLKSVVMRDEKGRPQKSHPIAVRAKTGTLNFVSALAGYLSAPDGSELAFAIFTADTPRRDRLSVAERERPQGGRQWNARSKSLQQALLQRWGALYGS